MEQLARTHVLYDIWVEDASLLNRLELWRTMLVTAAKESGATVIGQRFHQFSPHGLTGFLLLAESHISFHTWPEENLATIDIFTCGPMDTHYIIEQVRARLKPCHEQLSEVHRGQK